jgi:hypothetical protein
VKTLAEKEHVFEGSRLGHVCYNLFHTFFTEISSSHIRQ